MEMLNQLQQSANRLERLKPAMSSIGLYGESCALCAGYALAATDYDVSYEKFDALRQSMVRLYGESRVSGLENLQDNAAFSATVSDIATEYATSVVKQRIDVESSKEYKVLSQLRADASYVASQGTMASVGMTDPDDLRKQANTLFTTYAAVAGDMVSGIGVIKEMARDEMVRCFGEDIVGKLDGVSEARISGDKEMFDKIVNDAVDAYVVSAQEAVEDAQEDIEDESESKQDASVQQVSDDKDTEKDESQEETERVPRSVAANMQSESDGLQSDDKDVQPEY